MSPVSKVFHAKVTVNIGLKRLVKEIGVEHLRSEHINLTLSKTKRRMDIGTLVVPFDQTFHPLHISRSSKIGPIGGRKICLKTKMTFWE